MKLTIHLSLMHKLRMNGAIPLPPHMPSRLADGKLKVLLPGRKLFPPPNNWSNLAYIPLPYTHFGIIRVPIDP